MLVDMRQGIIKCPLNGINQNFMTSNITTVSLSIDNGRVDLSFANGQDNYLFTETTSIANAWVVPIANNCWLYWDLDVRTAVRTFGITESLPIYGSNFPSSPVEDQHFFNLTDNKMYVYILSNWRPKIRVFACRYNNGIFFPLNSSFIGSQVGLSSVGNLTGRVIIDDTGNVIKKGNGQFFTSESLFFINGSPVNTIKLETSVLVGTATENINKYSIVNFNDFGKINLATYSDTQQSIIAVAMEDTLIHNSGSLCVQGIVNNPNWDFPIVGQELWISDTTPGTLTEINPNIANPLSSPYPKVPVARVITPTSIYFDQGMGGMGSPGDIGNLTTLTNTISTQQSTITSLTTRITHIEQVLGI